MSAPTMTALDFTSVTTAEQEMLDLMLLHPQGIREDDLNPKKRVRRAAALARWKVDGIVIPVGTHYYPRVQLDPAVVTPEALRDAHARALAPHWRILQDADAALEEQRAFAAQVVARVPDLLRATGSSNQIAEDFGALQHSADWPRRSVLDEVANASWGVYRVRIKFDKTGLDWQELIDRTEELIAAERVAEAASAAAEAARQAMIDPDADPLGGDA